jgi:hypothetical protein
MTNYIIDVNPAPVKRQNRDPLDFLASKRQISQSQYSAGLRLQRAFEIANHGGLQSADMARDIVDGSRCQHEPNAKRLRACADLALTRAKLGTDFALVEDVLARGLYLIEAAIERGLTAEMAQRKLNKQFRASLETMALAFSTPNTKAA